MLKPRYEVALYIPSNHTSTGCEIRDYKYPSNYYEAARMAKEYSKHIGEKYVGAEKDELVKVSIVCFLGYDDGNDNIDWEEFYSEGKKQNRIQH